MKSFLEDVVSRIVDENEDHLEDVCIVIPGKRPKLYIQQLLAKKLNKVFWSPEIISISDFFEVVTEKQSTGSFEIMLEFYDYLRTHASYTESFSAYLNWAPTAISDFSDIDHYMLDAQSVYANLQSFKEIEEWSFLSDELSSDQDVFNDFWQKLGSYYKHFNEFLISKDYHTHATLSRFAAENIEEYHSTNPFSHIYFLGFNALTKSEQTVIFNLEQMGVASVFWDSDRYYLEDELQEAGHFHRAFKKEVKEFLFQPNHIVTSKKEIGIHKCSSHIAQVHAAANLIESIRSNERIAVLLGEESMALPLLAQLAARDCQLNISIGLPLTTSLIYHLFNRFRSIFSFLKKNPGRGLNFKSFGALRSNLLFNTTLENAGIETSVLVEKIIGSNQNNIDLKYLQQNTKLGNVAESLFDFLKWNQKTQGSELLEYFDFLLAKIREIDHLSDIEYSFLNLFEDSIKEVKNLTERCEYLNEPTVLFDLLDRHLKSQEIPFVGDKTTGIQLTGVLESRTLDFDHVVMLGMNEGSFPKENKGNSFFPFELRRHFGLPAREEQEAVYAYYFYRLFQRSSKIDLFYNEMNETFGATEKSRFLLQVEEELGDTQSTINLFEHGFTDALAEDSVDGIKTSADIISSLDGLLKNGISASGLNTFITCPLDFYFKYLMGFRESEEVTSDIEASTFGSIIHDTLEEMYKSVKGKILTKDHIVSFKSDLENLLQTFYNKHMKGADWKNGYNFLSYKASESYILDFLSWEEKNIDKLKEKGLTLEVFDLEKKLESELELEIGGEKKKIKLKGFIDRIDKIGDKYRIIDYKTGKVEFADLKLPPETEDPFSIKPKALQVLVYLYLFTDHYKKDWRSTEGGIISLRNLNSGFIRINPGKKKDEGEFLEELKENFGNILGSVLSEMYHPEFIWKHENSSKYCSYCS